MYGSRMYFQQKRKKLKKKGRKEGICYMNIIKTKKTSSFVFSVECLLQFSFKFSIF